MRVSRRFHARDGRIRRLTGRTTVFDRGARRQSRGLRARFAVDLAPRCRAFGWVRVGGRAEICGSFVALANQMLGNGGSRWTGHALLTRPAPDWSRRSPSRSKLHRFMTFG
jgi:hypothetical protein